MDSYVLPLSRSQWSKFIVSVNKQINDKERVAAAMENPNLLELIETCIEER